MIRSVIEKKKRSHIEWRVIKKNNEEVLLRESKPNTTHRCIGQVDTTCVVAKHRCSLLHVLSVFALCKVTESESMSESESYTFGVSHCHHVVIVLFILLFLFFLSSFSSSSTSLFYACFSLIQIYIRKCIFVFLRVLRRRHRLFFSKRKLRERERERVRENSVIDGV